MLWYIQVPSYMRTQDTIMLFIMIDQVMKRDHMKACAGYFLKVVH